MDSEVMWVRHVTGAEPVWLALPYHWMETEGQNGSGVKWVAGGASELPQASPSLPKEAEQEAVEEMHIIHLVSFLRSQAYLNLPIRVVTYSSRLRHIQNLALHEIKFEN